MPSVETLHGSLSVRTVYDGSLSDVRRISTGDLRTPDTSQTDVTLYDAQGRPRRKPGHRARQATSRSAQDLHAQHPHFIASGYLGDHDDRSSMLGAERMRGPGRGAVPGVPGMPGLSVTGVSSGVSSDRMMFSMPSIDSTAPQTVTIHQRWYGFDWAGDWERREYEMVYHGLNEYYQKSGYLMDGDISDLTRELLLRSLDQDPYDEDQAEMRALFSKPTCFIILGKPGAGKTTLARKLAIEWKCQLLNATEVIAHEIELQTEMGQKAQEILLRGEAIPQEFAERILYAKINSPEVAHHGYILDDYPCMNEEYMTVKEQMDLIKNMRIKPDFIINLKIPDKDLEERRIGQRVDTVTGDIYTKDVWDPVKPVKQQEKEDDGEEEEEEDVDDEEEPEDVEFEELPPEILERLIKRPEDLPTHVAEDIANFKERVLRIIEDYMADFDQQYLIELDANKPVKVLFQELLSRLQCFVLRHAAVATRLIDQEEEEAINDEVETDELMRSTAAKNMVAPRYRWRRSKWGRLCPVSLAEGNMLQGKAEFAISFLDKMYFMSSEEAMTRFLRNPRMFVTPPQPRPPCKIIVTGPQMSGKTTISHMLAQKYGAKVIDMQERMRIYIEDERAKAVEAARAEATEEAIVRVKQKLREQIEAERAQKRAEADAEEEAAAKAAAAEAAAAGEGEADGEKADVPVSTDAAPTDAPVSTEAPTDAPVSTEAAPTDAPVSTEAEAAAEGAATKAAGSTEEAPATEDAPKGEPDAEAETKLEAKKSAEEEKQTADEKVEATSKTSVGAPLTPPVPQHTSSEIEQKAAEGEAAAPEGEAEPREVQSDGEEEKKVKSDRPMDQDTLASVSGVLEIPPPSSEGVQSSSDRLAEIDANNAEVQALVQEAVKAAEEREVQVSPEVWIEEMEKAVRDVESEARTQNPKGPMWDVNTNGGYVFDNFPLTKEQWSLLLEKGGEKGILPDDIIVLRDESENGEYLLKRWYLANRSQIDEDRKLRLEKEEAERLAREEEERLAAEEKRLQEEAERKAAEEAERQRKLEEGEEVPEEGAPKDEAQSEAAEVEQESTPTERPEESTPASQFRDGVSEAGETEPEKLEGAGDATAAPTEEGSEPKEEEVRVPEGPETDSQKEKRRAYDAEWVNCHRVITSSSSIEPITIDVFSKSEEGEVSTPDAEEVFKTIVELFEKKLTYAGWEMQGMDIDEDEEDAELDVGEEEEEEEEAEEEVDPNRAVKKQLGDTNFYCPVALKERGVLWPGNPEIASKFREKTYYLSTPEARDEFLENPTKFLPKDQPFTPPPIRLIILGPKGAGKSLHGRHLAAKLGLFHIKYRERLQELVLAKTKKRIGPEYEEPEEEEEEEEEEDEDEADGAITAPDGSKVEMPPEQAVSADADPPKGEEEEEAAPQFTEDEEHIVSYLKEDEPLPNEVLDKIVPAWWNEEPFKSTGFILEGFPHNSDEAEYMATQGLFPDCAVIVSVEDTDVIARLLPPKMERWKEKRNKKLEKRAKKKEKARKKREEAMEKRRKELQKEADERKEERRREREAEKAERGSDEEDEEEAEEEEEEEEEDDIEALLAEEFEEEEEEEDEDEETEEDANDRMRNDLEDIYDKYSNALAAVQDKLEEMLVSRYEVDGGRKAHIVRYQINKKLKQWVDFRHSLFERCYPIRESVALKMLHLGYKQPSRFGRWCPVKLYDGDCMQPLQTPGQHSYPVVYRSFIYFLSSSQARERFMKDPMTFLKQPSPKPVVPIRMAIVGPPKSGKTTLAKRFAEDYGMVRLSIGEAMRTLLETQPKTALTQELLSYLKRGLTVPDELAIQALQVAMMDMRCQTRGFILDGYPVTKEQVDIMTRRSIIPVRVIECVCDSKEIVTRATADRYSPQRVLPLHDSAKILTVKMAAYNKEVGAVRDFYTDQHANVVKLDANKSKWWTWHEANDAALSSVRQIQSYLERVAQGKAASIADMCITPLEFEQRLGVFMQYCPVSLALRGELVDCSVEPSLKYAAEFRGHYYKMAGPQELQLFLEAPERFVPPLAPLPLPSDDYLPKRRTADDIRARFPIQVELQGYCPVTYLDGKCRYEALVEGNNELVVEYRKKLYYFESEEKLQQFMRKPEKYWNLKLPHKLPPKQVSIPVTNLPMLGYMEQTVSHAIQKSLTSCGNFKPKYPFMTATKSALVYIAFHLKAFNPRSSEYVRKKYKRKLMSFEDSCELIGYLGNTMTKRYKEPQDRPLDFDGKLKRFVALKEQPQSPDVWATLC